MRLLLDTHVVLWQLSGERELSAAATQAITSADDLLMSVVSYAEIGVKGAVGKLEVPADLEAQIAAAGVRQLPLSPAHGLAVADLPVHHRDPFDRLIIAQALIEQLTVVTADQRFHDYGIDIVSA
ncbi:MAG TPA: type II toxin-antitoxin system VapC family toxin [Intrasporangiaceae bacterium]|nr:type II toxin-antitoxin system VapC family toxin [Intrasporangiaceae bacterium]